jgi:hypothetical protein
MLVKLTPAHSSQDNFHAFSDAASKLSKMSNVVFLISEMKSKLINNLPSVSIDLLPWASLFLPLIFFLSFFHFFLSLVYLPAQILVLFKPRLILTKPYENEKDEKNKPYFLIVFKSYQLSIFTFSSMRIYVLVGLSIATNCLL